MTACNSISITPVPGGRTAVLVVIWPSQRYYLSLLAVTNSSGFLLSTPLSRRHHRGHFSSEFEGLIVRDSTSRCATNFHSERPNCVRWAPFDHLGVTVSSDFHLSTSRSGHPSPFLAFVGHLVNIVWGGGPKILFVFSRSIEFSCPRFMLLCSTVGFCALLVSCGIYLLRNRGV